jgi:hypothetical protein
MKTAILLLFSFATVALALSQNTSCPLQPKLVKNVNSQISVDFQNTSRKQLASYQFGLIFFDSNGQAHSFPHPLTGNIPLRAQLRRVAIWQSRLSLQFLFPLAQVYLVQAKFSDGTGWTDNGSKACSVTSVQE